MLDGETSDLHGEKNELDGETRQPYGETQNYKTPSPSPGEGAAATNASKRSIRAQTKICYSTQTQHPRAS